MFLPLTTVFSLSSLICLMSLATHRKHFLMSLLFLEAFMLSMALFIPSVLISVNNISVMFVMILLTMGACEASLGLSLLVLMARSCGNDLMKSITKNLC